MKAYFEDNLERLGMSNIADRLLVVGNDRRSMIHSHNEVLILTGNAGKDKDLLLKELVGSSGKICSLEDTLHTYEIVKAPDFKKNLFKAFADQTGRFLGSMRLLDYVDLGIVHDFCLNNGYKDELTKNVIMSMCGNDFKPNLVYSISLDELDKLEHIVALTSLTGYDSTNVHIIACVDEIGGAIQDVVAKAHANAAFFNGELWIMSPRAALEKVESKAVAGQVAREPSDSGQDARSRADFSQHKLLQRDGYTAIKLKAKDKDCPVALSDEDIELIKLRVLKASFACPVDLESYFTQKKIGPWDVDVLDIGAVTFPTGKIIACDPRCSFDEAQPQIDELGQGTFRVKICVVPHKKIGIRYAAVKLEVSKATPVYYELSLTKDVDLEEELEEDECYGFWVDRDMGCFADLEAVKALNKYVAKRIHKDGDFELYSDYIEPLLAQSAKDKPKYQHEYGDWALIPVPDTFRKIPIFHSGLGDGFYPVYVGFDEEDKICAMYILFIDIEADSAYIDIA